MILLRFLWIYLIHSSTHDSDLRKVHSYLSKKYFTVLHGLKGLITWDTGRNMNLVKAVWRVIDETILNWFAWTDSFTTFIYKCDLN